LKYTTLLGTFCKRSLTPAVACCQQVHTLNTNVHLFAALLCYLDATGAETSLPLTALNSSHPIHAVDGHCARNSCINLLWLHPNHKMSITYHKTESVVTNPQAGGLPLKKFA